MACRGVLNEVYELTVSTPSLCRVQPCTDNTIMNNANIFDPYKIVYHIIMHVYTRSRD